jgi:CheY-like chemotaxis protein
MYERPSVRAPATNATCHCHVLLAEDDEANAAFAEAALCHFSCRVQVVFDGAAAFSAASGGLFDIIFMDFHMPRMDGLEATRAIRAIESRDRRPRTPIVAITASAMPNERRRCLEAGMDDVLIKPFMLDALRQVLHDWAGAT